MIITVMLDKSVRQPHKKTRIVCEYVRCIEVKTGRLRFAKWEDHKAILERVKQHPSVAYWIEQGYGVGMYRLAQRRKRRTTASYTRGPANNVFVYG